MVTKRIRFLPITAYISTIKGLFKNFIKREAIYPFYASFKLTSRCHFGCPFCSVKKDKTTDLSTEEIKRILLNLSRSSILMTSFEGGEPLLRNDIGELLKFARKCNFYLLFTTSVKNLLDYPLEEYTKYIDFLHISIDEGHNNLELFNALPVLRKFPSQVSVQTVVTKDTIDKLEEKVRLCKESDANIVVIPATHMDGTDNFFPDIEKLEVVMANLRKKYPYVIHTPQGYFKAYKKARCSTASIIISPDGSLYYPCHILKRKGPDLRHTDITEWLSSEEAREGRKIMRECKRNCGWYQYYSIESYTSFSSVMETLRPIFRFR